MKYSHLLVLALSVLMLGCASTTSREAGQQPRRQQNVLTQEEMREAHQNNVYEAVAALRTNWLRPRGQASFRDPNAGQVVVFLNGILVGGPDYLRQLSTADVTSLQFLNASEAASRFGLQTSSGPAIVISTSPGR